MKRNRFIKLDAAAKSVNRELEQKARALAGLKGYLTNLAACPDGTPVTARRYRTIEIQAGHRTITAAGPLPDDLRHAFEAINNHDRLAH